MNRLALLAVLATIQTSGYVAGYYFHSNHYIILMPVLLAFSLTAVGMGND